MIIFDDYLSRTFTLVEPIISPLNNRFSHLCTSNPILSDLCRLVIAPSLPFVFITISKQLNNPKADPHLDRCMCTTHPGVKHPTEALVSISQHSIGHATTNSLRIPLPSVALIISSLNGPIEEGTDSGG